jgi:urea transport system ATP-binding protein
MSSSTDFALATTLLDLICGKTQASGGSIKFNNEEITKLPEHTRVRRGIGRKFQTPSIYENLTLFQNLEVSFPKGRGVFGALFFQCDAEVRERIDAVAAEIGLHELLDTEAGLLQRISKNRSVIVIEHDMDFVAQIAHKVTVMHQGKILAEGSMDKVQNDPKVIDVYLGH